ncbi:MAG TPA: hypothetical protein DCS48_05425 [Desulfovibrio sp.]|nr:hypothetical protein [Desulfovibrio sp.]
MSKHFNYISLFSGAGGLDIGLERSGLKAISMCEIENVFCDTLRENAKKTHSDGMSYFNSTKIINSDIRELDVAELTLGKEIDLVVGGPPCQSFSSSGKQLSILDPRGALLDEFLRFIDEIQPKMFLFENVRGLVTARDRLGTPGGVITNLVRALEDIGYSCRAGLLNSADFGSYQRRVRCFIIGTKQGLAPEFPHPTHNKSTNLLCKKWRSLQDFLEKHADKDSNQFMFPSEKLAPQLINLPNGSGLKSKGKAEKTRPGGHWGYRQGTFIADLSLPARTVTGSSSQDWVRWDGLLRRLTLNEVKLLQGFPEDWDVLGTKTQKYKQIGNAVPTLFGQLLGETIGSFLAEYPKKSPEFLGIPQNFKGYIDYTKRDHERNKASRSIHKHFTLDAV